MTRLSTFLPFLLLVMGGGIAIGILTAPGEWYAALEKPAFNPPNWIFGPVWTALYLIIAFVGWRIWKQKERGIIWPLWIVQMALNFLWSPVFFAAQNPALALVVILSLLLCLVLFVRKAWHPDRLSAVLFLPYIAWVGFASALNVAIVFLNSSRDLEPPDTHFAAVKSEASKQTIRRKKWQLQSRAIVFISTHCFSSHSVRRHLARTLQWKHQLRQV